MISKGGGEGGRGGGQDIYHFDDGNNFSLRKHAYSNLLKILPPKNENFQIKHSDILDIFALNILLVLVSTTSMRRS